MVSYRLLGYVSMAWHLASSLTTPHLDTVSSQIQKQDLRPGDMLLAKPVPHKSGHAVLFENWANSAHSSYWAYEFGDTPVTHRAIAYPYDDNRTFRPYRYNNVLDDPAPIPAELSRT